MKLKTGVRFGNSQIAISTALIVVNDIFFQEGLDCVITSANDSIHSTGSLHYKDAAFDFRSKHIHTSEKKHEILAKIRENLTQDFDVLLENEDKEQEHYHLEFDPE